MRESRFGDSARRSLEWLVGRQDDDGGWERHSAFSLAGAQCVFDGFDTYRQLTQEPTNVPLLFVIALVVNIGMWL